jgi:hypothetical protein
MRLARERSKRAPARSASSGVRAPRAHVPKHLGPLWDSLVAPHHPGRRPGAAAKVRGREKEGDGGGRTHTTPPSPISEKPRCGARGLPGFPVAAERHQEPQRRSQPLQLTEADLGSPSPTTNSSIRGSESGRNQVQVWSKSRSCTWSSSSEVGVSMRKMGLVEECKERCMGGQRGPNNGGQYHPTGSEAPSAGDVDAGVHLVSPGATASIWLA